MEKFYVVEPSPILRPYVKNYWLLKTAAGAEVARTVPTGMMSLIFHRGYRLKSMRDGGEHPRVFLSGHESTFDDLQYAGQVDMISVVFRPAGVRAFFNLPMNEIEGLRVTAGDLEDRGLAGLEEALQESSHLEKVFRDGAGDDRACIGMIERFLMGRLAQSAGHNLQRSGHSFAEHNIKRIEAAVGLIGAGCNDIVSLADTACLSTRQFQRIFAEYTGATPKEYARIIRFQRALHFMEREAGASLTELAYKCGYYDQSHMIRDFRTLSGYTPGEYLAMCPPHSDYFG